MSSQRQAGADTTRRGRGADFPAPHGADRVRAPRCRPSSFGGRISALPATLPRTPYSAAHLPRPGPPRVTEAPKYNRDCPPGETGRVRPALTESITNAPPARRPAWTRPAQWWVPVRKHECAAGRRGLGAASANSGAVPSSRRGEARPGPGRAGRGPRALTLALVPRMQSPLEPRARGMGGRIKFHAGTFDSLDTSRARCGRVRWRCAPSTHPPTPPRPGRAAWTAGHGQQARHAGKRFGSPRLGRG